MAVLHLGFMTTYLSDALVSGFTTGAACHVFMAQVNKVLGVKLPRYEGFAMLFYVSKKFLKKLSRDSLQRKVLNVT